MKVSVIVPMWNVAPYIEGCLASIAAQTHRDLECICVDDGSPDNAGDLADAFAQKDKRFRVIRQQNMGLSGARNTGLEHACGEVVSFVDADDYIHPHTLETVLAVMKKENVDVIGFGFQKTSARYTADLPKLPNSPTHIFQNPLSAFMTRRDVPTSSCVRLYRRTFIQDMRFVVGLCFEDVVWTTEVMSKLNKYVFVDSPFYYYYTNPNSLMQSCWTNEKTDSYLTVINLVYDYLAQHRPKDLKIAQKCILNSRVKMIFNRIKKMPKAQQPALWAHAIPLIRELYANGRISYSGLKLKHKLTLLNVLK